MNDIYGPAMLGVTSGMQAFMTMLPRLSDIRKGDPATDPGLAADVRMGEVAGVSLTLGLGVISSSLTRSPIPALTALVMSIVLVSIYESALRADRPFEARATLRVVPREGA